MKPLLKKLLLLYILLPFSFLSIAQPGTISLDSCYILAKNNYPLIKQHQLIAKANEYSVENIGKGLLPQFGIYGQGTYQSDITALPKGIPGFQELSKDQYKLYAEATQTIYAGGVLRAQKLIQQNTAAADLQKLESELYQIKDRINQLYFGILLTDEQLKLIDFLKEDIRSGINVMEALIANGAALKSERDILEAENLKTVQQRIELKANRKALTTMLGLFINRPMNENTVLTHPSDINVADEINRPELLWYQYQTKIFDAQANLLAAKNRPKAGLFFQGGLGRPALDMFKNSLEPYYIGGVKISFPLNGYYTLKREKLQLQINKDMLNTQKETFLFNVDMNLQQQNADLMKLMEILKTDDEMIMLRKKIKNTALAKLENGVINANDYLREVNAENSAVQNKILHEIQLLKAKYDKTNIAGN